MITKEEVLNTQKRWSDGLLQIVAKHQNGEDYNIEAEYFVDSLYAYDMFDVLFKPTLASSDQFRLDKVSALSYFVAGNKDYAEDLGFALKGWINVRWENAGIHIFSDCAIAMGNYYFTNNEGELKVEYSFVYKQDSSGILRIVLHDSHLPYQK